MIKVTRRIVRETQLELWPEPGGYRVICRMGDSIGDDDTAIDGVRRPGCHFVMHGLKDDDSDGEMETAVFRAFGEDDLRALAGLCLKAAEELKREEARRRKRLSPPIVGG
jgi:hypothetical protein